MYGFFKVFPSQQSLQEHFVSIHANESESEETDPSKNSKDVDMKTSELIEAVSLNNSKYKKCAKILPSTDNLTNKSNTKTENKNSGFKIVRKYFYSCHKCNLDFNSLKAYQAHLLTHGKTPGKLFFWKILIVNLFEIKFVWYLMFLLFNF